jgi:hypothetical protein
MTTGAGTTSEDDVLEGVSYVEQFFFWGCTYRAGVDCQTIILVLHDSVANSHTVALANIKSIGVVSTVRITIRVVDCDPVKNNVV